MAQHNEQQISSSGSQYLFRVRMAVDGKVRDHFLVAVLVPFSTLYASIQNQDIAKCGAAE
ncbi:hypothetical protein DPMN_008836 [Dreissena polymorpha]|uniref:Uncharacterized protein n=1 Tax=Dreissena polymorpha TaxID=45954 RepID=A0A9D4RXE6_DREPO|nr:hypothetical protein DPMN_008836 [Dreissena polymorpha]